MAEEEMIDAVVVTDEVIDVVVVTDVLDQDQIQNLEVIEEALKDVQNLAVDLVAEVIDQNVAKEEVQIQDQDQDALIQGRVLVIQDHQDQDVTDVRKISC